MNSTGQVVTASTQTGKQWKRCVWTAWLVVFLVVPAGVFVSRALVAQAPQRQAAVETELLGVVVDPQGHTVAGASVRLDTQDNVARTDSLGRFRFPSLTPGRYSVTAEASGLRSEVVSVEVQQGSVASTRIVLLSNAPHNSAGPSRLRAQAPEFSDQPDFVISGITDWTAVGGHGSDATLRTSEDLTRETARLKADTAARKESGGNDKGSLQAPAAPASEVPEVESRATCDVPVTTAPLEYAAALACQKEGRPQQALHHIQRALAEADAARYHRLAGELQEQLGDPLASVQQDQRATQLEPSEENYFAWGSELLLHRAIWQAAEVFSAGAQRHPSSARLRTGWGTALFAGARYEEAAQHLCEASDLDPAKRESYIFLGKVSIGTPAPLACVPSKLARFVEQEPDDPDANFYDAMLLLKDGRVSDADHAAALLRKAVALDPKYSAAYVQIGILLTAQHRYPEAIHSLLKAVAASPQEAEAHYRLGVLYERTGKADEAARELHTHELLVQEQARAVEAERRQVKQFLVTLQGVRAEGPTP